MTFGFYSSGNVFMQPVFKSWDDQVLPSFRGKNEVDIELGIRISHGTSVFIEKCVCTWWGMLGKLNEFIP